MTFTFKRARSRSTADFNNKQHQINYPYSKQQKQCKPEANVIFKVLGEKKSYQSIFPHTEETPLTTASKQILMNELQMCNITKPKTLEYKKILEDGLNKQEDKVHSMEGDIKVTVSYKLI